MFKDWSTPPPSQHDVPAFAGAYLLISVRSCYESRIGHVNVLQSNIFIDYTQVL